jgi:hypothetical protein
LIFELNYNEYMLVAIYTTAVHMSRYVLVLRSCTLCDTEYGQNFIMFRGMINNNIKGSLGCTFKGLKDNLCQKDVESSIDSLMEDIKCESTWNIDKGG